MFVKLIHLVMRTNINEDNFVIKFNVDYTYGGGDRKGSSTP